MKIKLFLKDNFDFRLDSEYFLKENLYKNKKIENFGYSKIGDFAYVTDGIHTSIDYCDESNVYLFSATTPRENYFDFSREAFISLKAHSENPRTALRNNDIIISTVGTIGNCAVVNNSMLPANSDRHVGIIRLENDKFKPRFISTFLLSKYGRYQTWRESTGNVQLNLFLYRIRTLKIPNIQLNIQNKIENIVIDSDNKRNFSQQKYREAEHLLLATLGLKYFQPSIETVNVKTFKESFATTSRLDAEYYQPKYEDYKNVIVNKEHTYIKNEYIQVKDVVERDLKEYNYIEIGDINVGDGMSTPHKVLLEDLPANGKLKAKKGDLLISKVRPYRGAVSIVDSDYENLVVSGAFTVLRNNDLSNYNNEVLKVLLRSNIYKDWLLQFNVGTSYPVIKDEDVLNLPIPFINNDLQQQIATLIQESFTLKAESERLLEVAKKAVEIAIEENEDIALDFINQNS